VSGREITDSHKEELRALGVDSVWVRNGEVDLHLLDYGGDRHPLLVLPGITTPAVGWDFVLAGIRDLVRPIVMDLRGRGFSGTGGDYSTPEFVGDAEAAVSQLALQRPLVLGHSLGARIATLLTLKLAGVAGLIAVDPPLSGPTRGPYPTTRSSFEAQLREARSGATADEIQAHLPAWPRSELALRARWLSTCDPEAVLKTYDWFAKEEFLDRWPEVECPAAFIYGEASPVVTAEGAADAFAANPRASYHSIPEAGHMIPWDNLAAFSVCLRAVLQEQLARTRGEHIQRGDA